MRHSATAVPASRQARDDPAPRATRALIRGSGTHTAGATPIVVSAGTSRAAGPARRGGTRPVSPRQRPGAHETGPGR